MILSMKAIFLGESFRLCSCSFPNRCVELIEFVRLNERIFSSAHGSSFPWKAAVNDFPNGVCISIAALKFGASSRVPNFFEVSAQ